MSDALPTLLMGNDPSALSAELRSRCVAALRAERERRTPGTVVWISPTYRAQRQATRALVEQLQAPCLSNVVCTFEGFAERLLRAAGRPATAISPTVRRLLLRRITQELHAAGQLQHFGNVVATAGFLDVVEGFISELKRDEVWPEEFEAVCLRSKKLPARDRELALIYSRYQQILQQKNWYDSEGRFWLARLKLEEEQGIGLPRWTWIGVSGFADFTYPQYEILARLVQFTDELVISLPGEPGTGRSNLFEKSATALRGLQANWSGLRPTWGEPRAAESSERRQIREYLFGNPRTVPQAQSAQSLRVVACTGSDSEMVSVALQLKAWLRSGRSPADMAVGLRNVTEEGLYWREGLAAAGLPVWSDAAAPLREAGIIKFFVAIFLAEQEDWPFSRLMGVLGSSYFQPANYPGPFATDVRAVSRALRALRLSQGRHDLLTGLEQTVARLARTATENIFDATLAIDDVDDVVYQSVSAEVYAAALRCLKWYAGLTERFRRARPLGEWIDLLAGLLQEFGVTDRPDADNQQAADFAAWDQCQRLLRDAAAAEVESYSAPRKLTAAEFLLEFRDLLAEERREPEPEPAGYIRILGLDQLRHLETPLLVIAGLTEESFPRRRSDDCLFSDTERREFVAQGLPVRHASLHQQEELLFFYQVVLSAREELLLTYPEVNHRGQPAFASPYLTALKQLWTNEALPLQHEGQLDPIPDSARTINLQDARLMATRAALSGDSGWLRELWEAPESRLAVTNLVAAMEMGVQRFETHGFTSYEGRLAEVTNQRTLAHRYHTDRQFSATELETYGACPFKFWLSHVLKIESLPEPESGTDVLRRGVVVHDVLSRLIEDMRPQAEVERLSLRFHQLVQEKLRGEIPESDLQRALLRIEDQILAEWATAYSEQFQQYATQVGEAWGGPWNSILAESPFGDVPNLQGAQSAPPLEFGSGSERVVIRGRIDRIDTGVVEGQSVYTVIDYKTGQRPQIKSEEVQYGRTLQLVLYAMAARRLGLVPADAIPFQLGYWCLKETGFQASMVRGGAFKPLDQAAWMALEEIVEETIPRLARGIRRGEFVVDNPRDDCTSRCEYRTVCRVNQIRPLADKLQKHRDAAALPEETP